MPDDAALAMWTSGRERVDRAFEAVEDVTFSAGDYLKRLVILIFANFTFSHGSIISHADIIRAERSLQSKTKPACFIDRVDLCPAALFELGRPVEKRFFLESLGWLGIGAAHLHHHRVKILVHIDPKLDHFAAAIKLAAGFLG
jgi:hypothetical protein